jgi:hypothetical protein
LKCPQFANLKICSNCNNKTLCLCFLDDHIVSDYLVSIRHTKTLIFLLFDQKQVYYLDFQSFDFERTWWRLFQRRVVCTNFDIYMYVFLIFHLDANYFHPHLNCRVLGNSWFLGRINLCILLIIACHFLLVIASSVLFPIYGNRIGGVMVSVLASSAVDRGFVPRSGQTKDYKICISCFSANHAGLRRKSKDWLARNQDNVSEWGDMSICGLLFQWSSTMEIQLSVLDWYKEELIIISLKIKLFSPWYSWKIAEWR